MLTGASLLLIGSVQMLRLHGRGWALLAAVVALLPWSPTWPLGVVVGLWALLVLRRADVRAAFR